MGGLDPRKNSRIRKKLIVKGIVQGVGFRPSVYNLAVKHNLTGFVLNQSGEVVIEVEGVPSHIDEFLEKLYELKRPAYISELKKFSIEPLLDKDFSIVESKRSEKHAPLIFPPDLRSCQECNREVLEDETSRYFHYPFTSCTYCGPRYTTIQRLPYDRKYTSMDSFQMCESCRKEYETPTDRRFHAQTIACPDCGPSVTIYDSNGNHIREDWLDFSTASLLNGKIIAMKGLGGFHLLCDATNEQTLERLRERKRRPQKPLALMIGSIDIINMFFDVSSMEQKVLMEPSAPILLLKPKPHTINTLPLDLIAPGIHRIGVMLPYTPMHALVAKTIKFMVATSGNRSGYPTAYRNEEAITQLNEITDYYLLHDRKIMIRADDSVGQVIEESHFAPIRRSRGFVPETIPFPNQLKGSKRKIPIVFGAGSEMKNTFCYLFQGAALFSQHIGDIDNIEHLEAYDSSVQHFSQLLGIEPDIVGYDPHPDFLISKKVKERWGDKAFPVYHHHAHMVSCMVENQLEGPAIGCILDGTGYGNDQTMWGFEILTGDCVDFERACHMTPITLPGGEKGIKNPWMVGISLLYEGSQNQNEFIENVKRFFPDYVEMLPVINAQLEGKLPSPQVSSAGRLFDGISSILGLCDKSTYEGEAAVILSEAIEAEGIGEHPRTAVKSYPFTSGNGKWSITDMIKGILNDLYDGIPKIEIIIKFHHTISQMVHEGVMKAHRKSGINEVVLSGGVWNNRYLLSYTKHILQESGFIVHTHQKVPCGDGGIALGQAVSALWRWNENNVSVHTSESHVD